ncbi:MULTISPECIES: hypothetical protein [Tropicimonas]|uniref:Chitin binding Peritrophin-A domain-containing protein n=2 Tax=Tropicimonas TaxID=599652 RepID=A0A239JWZ9_9RHOB|nr:hypothetical protein [Tropicimonas sediminicola]SNT10496.1 hypothetical protein SAMN05421757_106124 [Tropicimonas sediminicola]
MRLKTTLAALALAALPAVAVAECSWDHSNKSATTCPEGSVLDSTTGSCVKQTTS